VPPICGAIFEAARPDEELTRLETKAAAPDFWKDQAAAQSAMQRRRRLEQDRDLIASLRKKSDDLAVLVEWSEAGEPVDAEFAQGLEALDQEVQAGEIKKMLGGEHDRKNAIITIHPGAGGTESQDWAEMLLRMYMRWTERRGFKREMMDYQPGEEAGLKSATLAIIGEYAYGLLSAEAGVHRLAIRITHLPTGLVVSCQNERSQHRNRDSAMKVLKARLYDIKIKENQAKLAEISGAKKEIGFGSQIRSYVMHPYQLVKDHRTKEQVNDVNRVLDGDIDVFIKSYLMKRASGTLGQPTADEDLD
jgi:peptide chain release factor 2